MFHTTNQMKKSAIVVNQFDDFNLGHHPVEATRQWKWPSTLGSEGRSEGQ